VGVVQEVTIAPSAGDANVGQVGEPDTDTQVKDAVHPEYTIDPSELHRKVS
jgi:hypothetical protein